MKFAIQTVSLRTFLPTLTICLLVSFLSFPVHAADDDDDLVTTNRDRRPIEELFKTDTVFPQDKGELEVELGTIYQHNFVGDTFALPVSLEYGLTDSWQLESEWNSYVQHMPRNGTTTRGIGDLELGTQYILEHWWFPVPRRAAILSGNSARRRQQGFKRRIPRV